MNPKLMTALSEAEFQAQVIELAHWRRWLVYHALPSTVRSGRWATHAQGDAGFLDLVLARGGVVLLRELKTDRGRVSAKQQRWLDATGGSVWRPRDWDHIQVELR